MAVVLTPDQELATKEFMESVGAASRATAVRFLLARKFDVRRARELYEQHEATRRQEGLLALRPFEEPLSAELATAKFTVLPTRDDTGAAIAIFTAKKHFPALTTHQTTLQGLVYQLDAALTSPETQRAGLVFVYDMTDSKYTNFDYDLSQKILTMLKGGYPARLKKVLIVTAPLWFKAPFRILRLFVREKLRERVHTVGAPQLAAHLPRAALPAHLGGALALDHRAWLERCKHCFLNNYENCDLNGDVDNKITDLQQSKLQNGVIQRDSSGDLRGSDGDMHVTSETRHTRDQNGDLKSGHSQSDDDDLDISSRGAWSSEEEGDGGGGGGGGETPRSLYARVRSLGRRGLRAEYDEIRAAPPQGTFHHARLAGNLAKNRYTDVLCYDHTRVVLPRTDPADATSDYINANYVDGHCHPRAYICTQGPLPTTCGDFWRMVWASRSGVVVMATRAVERGRVKCAQYWPATPGTARYGKFEVQTARVDAHPDYTISHIVLTDTESACSRRVWHAQYTAWADYGVPGGGARALLDFLALVRRAQADHVAELGGNWTGHERGPPIVVHCSAGIGRTGTFITVDVCARQLAAAGACSVRGAVRRVRAQRAHAVQMPDQYVFCHRAVLEYAVMNGMLEPVDFSMFDEDNEESD